MFKLSILLLAAASASFAVHAQVGGTRYGNTTQYNNGVTANQYGNTTQYSNGWHSPKPVDTFHSAV